MEAQLNLTDVDDLVGEFFKEREQGIATMHRIYFKNDNQLSLRALKEELTNELRTGCTTFINNGSPIEELGVYLFYIANAFCRKTAKPQIKPKIEYICPGCLFLGKEYYDMPYNKIFQCDECGSELARTSDPKKVVFFRTFYRHNKNGYRCPDCKRFIPHPMDNALIVSCPYFDCMFVGKTTYLNRGNHPTSKSNPEKLILDVSKNAGPSVVSNIASNVIDAHTQMEMEEDLQIRVRLLKEIIETQINSVPYSSASATAKHKQYVYQSFASLLDKFPTEMADYLFGDSDINMGFQHKVFQEYIRLLEDDLPFFVSTNRKLHKVDSLLDSSLCLFDGISVFDAVVNDRRSIKNGTKEFYIGGRKASYAKPFYIGKLLNIMRCEDKSSLMHLVKEYSFSKIKLRDIEPGTQVIVTHLRVPPHYQMGGMSYVNRIRKKIVERAKALLKLEEQ